MTDPNSAPRRFLSPLHGLRGLMAAWVVAYHVSPSGLGPFRVAGYGYLAVDVFFVLSGFVLSHAHGAEFRHPNWPTALRFLRLRWWRTYPLYAAGILLSLAAFVLVRGHPPAPADLLASVLLLERWAAPGIGMNTPVWSLGVEWLGYLAFPALAWACARLPGRLAVAWAASAVLAEMAVLQALGGALNVSSGVGAVARMAGGFAAGCMLASAGRPGAVPTPRADAGLVLVVAAAAGTLLLAPDIWCLPLVVAGVWLVSRPGPATAALLSARLPLFLGRISFALYLCHWPVLKVVQAWQPPGSRLWGLAGSMVAVAVSVALAYALCRAVEEPLRRYGRHVVQARASALPRAT